MEGTTFLNEYLEVSDGLTVLTLNLSLQYFYVTAMHDAKPWLLSFPLSGRLSICVRVGLAVHQFLTWGESELPVQFWLMGVWEGLWGILSFWFFFTLKVSPSQKQKPLSTPHTEKTEKIQVCMSFIRDSALSSQGSAQCHCLLDVPQHPSLLCTLC